MNASPYVCALRGALAVEVENMVGNRWSTIHILSLHFRSAPIVLLLVVCVSE